MLATESGRALFNEITSTNKHRPYKAVELSTDRILGQVAKMVTTAFPVQRPAKHLDIGSGTGALIQLLRTQNPNLLSAACDYTDTLMAIADQRVDVCDVNRQPLPYADDSFELVTCTEVVEHPENYRHLLREAYRVTKPGGRVIFSTPNVLNLQSRLRYFYFGFPNLFGPLPLVRDEQFSTVGHITPISLFYLAHALTEAGFVDISVCVDKFQRTSLFKLPIFYPIIRLFGAMALRRERKKFKTVDPSNAHFVGLQNRLKILLGRTVIVSARKPDHAA